MTLYSFVCATYQTLVFDTRMNAKLVDLLYVYLSDFPR